MTSKYVPSIRELKRMDAGEVNYYITMLRIFFLRNKNDVIVTCEDVFFNVTKMTSNDAYITHIVKLVPETSL